MILHDTSIVVPALLPTHEHHELVADLLGEADDVIAHVELETFAVLTRLPEPLRVQPHVAAGALAAAFTGERLSLPAPAQKSLVHQLANVGVTGGAAYDGLIALVAGERNATLCTRDVRAASTYGRLGATVRLVSA